MPTESQLRDTNRPYSPTQSVTSVHADAAQHDLDDLHLEPPSSLANPRPGKKSPRLSAKKVTKPPKGKWKRLRVPEINNGGCYLLDLPEDVLQALLSRLPPRALKALSATCKLLHHELQSETIWRHSYVNRFFYYGAARIDAVKREVEVLVQPCRGSGSGSNGGHSWRREALTRESMIERWLDSKSTMITHHPPVGRIDALSLAYPPYLTSGPKKLVVGKTHQTPAPPTPVAPPAVESPGASSGPPATPTVKMTHRQKYEALLAATTRPPPYILSAGLATSGVVRSDPISGKVSKGFWGPFNNANFHLRPAADVATVTTSIHLPSRAQTHALWGLSNGLCVHTTMINKPHMTHGGRASSVNVACDSVDAHEAPISEIWAPSGEIGRWVTAGQDGHVKYWKYTAPVTAPKPGKKSPGVESVPGRIDCLFTSETAIPFANRSDAVKRRQNGAPDPIILARCDMVHDVVCGVTVDGDLRVWLDITGRVPREVRIDVGSEEEEGGVTTLELDVRNGLASILVHHRRSPHFTRWKIDLTTAAISHTLYTTTHGSALSIVQAHLYSAVAISQPAQPISLLSPGASAGTPPPLTLGLDDSRYGRFVVAGDVDGVAWIWPWDSHATSGSATIEPMRAWQATSRGITALEYHCGLVAVASYDGTMKVFDPLPSPPELVRTFHTSMFSRLSPAEQATAASGESNAKNYTPNQILLEEDLVVASVGHKVVAWRAGLAKGRDRGSQTGKGLSSGDRRRSGPGRSDAKGEARLDVRKLHAEAADDHDELFAPHTPSRTERQQLAAMDQLGLEDGDDALQYALMISMEQAQGQPSIERRRASSGIARGLAVGAGGAPVGIGTGPDDEEGVGVDNGVGVGAEDGVGDGGVGVDGGVGGDEDSAGVDDEDGVDDDGVEEAIRAVEAFKRREADELEAAMELIQRSERQAGGG